MHRVRWTIALMAALGSNVAAAETVFIQAEDFTCDGTSWVARGQTDSYVPDSGVKHLWGAAGGQGVAHCDVRVPQSGHYYVWVRHTVMAGGEPAGNRGPFLVALKQGTEVLAEGRFDETPPEKDPPRIHGYVWSRFEADLTAGLIRAELSKLPPIDCSRYTRYVDCLVLATDPDYTPDPGDFQPKTWLRVTLGPGCPGPIYIHCFADHFRAPWYKHFSLSKDGYEQAIRPRRGAAAYLSAGESTPWCDITPAIHEDTGARLELRGAEKYSYTEWLPSFEATFEFATAPSEDAVVRRFERKGPGAGLVIVTPGVLNDESADKLRADYEYSADVEAFAKTLPPLSFGKRPEAFPFFLSMGLRSGLFAPAVRQVEFGVAAQMGFNGAYDRPDPMMAALGFRHTRTGPGAWYMDNGCYLQPQVERIGQKIAAEGAQWGDDPPTVVMFMDEPTAKPLEHATSCQHCAEVFRAWLEDELGVPLADLQCASWAEVEPVTEKARESRPALYYYSQRFRAKALADFLRLQTDEITKAYAGPPPATVNFSDGAVYAANMYLQGADYFDVFRSKALSMAWSEDWSNIASTYQCCGYNVDLLRAAASVHGQPIGMYVITSYGRTPLDVKLKAYSSLGRGASVLQSFAYGPAYAGHEPDWYMHKEMYQPMTELSHEIGGAEDLLLQAKRKPSQVAFLYSTTSDIWTTGVTDLYGHDRMHSYLALTHAQVPVDFLSEEDVAAGRLSPYQVLYVFGPNLLSEAAGPIAEWVNSGGTLYLAGGAAVADKYNRDSRPLDEMLGLSRGDVRTVQKYNGAGRYLRELKPAGQVRLADQAEASMSILGISQPIVMGAAEGVSVQARDAEGATMAARVNVGQGTVFVCGFMPGLSYIHSALSRRDADATPAPDADDPVDFDARGSFANLRPEEVTYNPWEYPQAERDFLLMPVREAGVANPVSLSQPLVEAFYLDGPAGAVITLANYAIRPMESLQVKVRPARTPKRVESVRQGALAVSVAEGELTTSLPLKDTDIIKLYW